LEEAADGNSLSLSMVPVIIYLSAALVFLLNLAFAIYEVEQVRLATPERVLQDELDLHPRHDDSHIRTSPWDEPMAT
jgi:hypothetical protein